MIPSNLAQKEEDSIDSHDVDSDDHEKEPES